MQNAVTEISPPYSRRNDNFSFVIGEFISGWSHVVLPPLRQ